MSEETVEPTWVTKLSDEALFRCLEQDIEMLNTGEWEPSVDAASGEEGRDDGCVAMAEVVAEIKRRMKSLAEQI